MSVQAANTAYNRTKYWQRRETAIARLGGKCEGCGTEEVLEFDHRDPETKLFNIADGWKKPIDIFLTEIDKCQLLCRPCHVAKTLANKDGGRGELQHGTYACYRWQPCRCVPCKEAEVAQRRGWANRPRRTCGHCKRRVRDFVVVDGVVVCTKCPSGVGGVG